MQRRTLLKGMTAALALHSAPVLDLAVRAATPRLPRRARPTDPGWPDAASWQKLKDAVGGNLIQVQPLFAPCSGDPKNAACREVTGNIRNPFFLGDQPAGTQVSGWLDAWTPAPSAYAVKARNAADISAAINFARERNLRLVVKGAGHSYQGTSNAADSLLIWTRAMNDVTLHDAFVPKGSAAPPVPAVTAGAGAVWIDLYHSVTNGAGRYVQGGGCTDVGVAGLVQSGGFGSFSKAFGTAASSLLEAEIVTADGQIRTTNANTEPELFWAIKGGGGGSWGVVTRLTLRTHDLPTHFGSAWGKIKADSDAAFRTLIARFVAFYASDLFNPHWGEQISLGPDNTLEISMVCQGLDEAQPKQIWKPFFDWVVASTKDFHIAEERGARATQARHWWDVRGNDSMIPDTRKGVPAYHGWWQGDQDQVAAFIHAFDSLWLPASLLTKNNQSNLVDALFAASRHKKFSLHFNKGLAGAPADAKAAATETATNPAVGEAFALAIIADGGGPAYPGFPGAPIDLAAAHKDARAIDLATAELRRVAPAAGSYVSESNYFNVDWREAFWGDNYPRLRAVKDKYDPHGLFFVHHGVGSEDWSADGFTRVRG